MIICDECKKECKEYVINSYMDAEKTLYFVTCTEECWNEFFKRNHIKINDFLESGNLDIEGISVRDHFECISGNFRVNNAVHRYLNMEDF